MNKRHKRQGRIGNKKTWKLLITLILIILVLVLVAVVIFIKKNGDETAPEISFENEVIFLSPTEVEEVRDGNTDCLLTGMQVWDDVDGDLTDKLIVHKVNLDESESYAFVTYRVMDKAGNISNAQRIAYSIPKEQVTKRFIEIVAKSLDININPEEVENNFEAPILKMQSEIIVNLGEPFQPENSILMLTDNNDNRETLLQNAVMEGVVDVEQAGVYEVSFTVSDSEGNISEPSYVKVYVVE